LRSRTRLLPPHVHGGAAFSGSWSNGTERPHRDDC
jgi:hypothetical protein